MNPQYQVTGDLIVTRMEIKKEEKNQSASTVQLRVKNAHETHSFSV